MAAKESLDEGLLDRFLEGDRVALARAISLVENLRPGFEHFLHAISPRLGRAHRIGVTGPPGAGKSTLTSRLTSILRARGDRVGIVAIDPTSTFTGGALLGDRIRMNDFAGDTGVFIRSMATRGALGGLAMSSKEVADLLDAFGFDRIIMETVGVGQSELDIAEIADTTVVVLVPESGDSIQAMKAGLMEIADLFVVNKSDRPGADKLAQELEVMLHMRTSTESSARMSGLSAAESGKGRRPARGPVAPVVDNPEQWVVQVLKTVAQKGDGIDALVDTLDQHRAHLEISGELVHRRRRRLAGSTRAAVERELKRLLWRGEGERILSESLAALEAGRESAYSIAAAIVDRFRNGNRPD